MRYVLNPLRSMAPMGEVARKLEADELTRDHLLPHSFAVRIPGSKTAESAATGRVGRAAVALGPTRRALKAAEADCDLRLHDLRHCTGQWLAEEGVGDARIQTTLRHATASMTRRYTKQRDKGENANGLIILSCNSMTRLGIEPRTYGLKARRP